MREIKFRAWDKKFNVMQSPDNFYNEYISADGKVIEIEEWSNYSGGGYRTNEVSEDRILMQFTGLKDKNGKEIYEGDIIIQKRSDKPYSEKAKSQMVELIVEWFDGYSHHRTEEVLRLNPRAVENPSWFNERPSFRATPIDRKIKFHCHAWSGFHDCEVIGNIYEHPQLLEATT